MSARTPRRRARAPTKPAVRRATLQFVALRDLLNEVKLHLEAVDNSLATRLDRAFTPLAGRLDAIDASLGELSSRETRVDRVLAIQLMRTIGNRMPAQTGEEVIAAVLRVLAQEIAALPVPVG